MKNSPTESQWAWVSGILEGEGYFNIRPLRKQYLSPCITVRMTDKDIIERLFLITGVGSINGPYRENDRKRKPIWDWRVGNREDVKWILVNCLPWFGQRRGDRARHMLGSIPERTPYPVERIKEMRQSGSSLRAIAKEVKICETVIQRICIGKRDGGYYRQRLLPSG